jgi:hypothetical protein
MPEVSIVVPVFNERQNVDRLYQELILSLKTQPRRFEIVIVDDGSRDGTAPALHEISKVDKRVKLILLKRNFGQTAAMMAGIQNARGDTIVTIDGDLQNDPADIPMMLDKLDQGFDLVHGWRRNRQDKTISRKIPSIAANWLISKATNFPIHDLGCTLKAMRSDVAKQLELYGEMHRFIPILAHQLGARCTEVVTGHRAREFGKSKYGINRTPRVILDLLTVKFLTDYKPSPMKLLGMAGLIASGLSCASVFATAMMWALSSVAILTNPLMILAIVLAAVAVQMFSLGIIAETCIRIYFTSEKNQSYQVREYVNFETKSQSKTDPIAPADQSDLENSNTDQDDDHDSQFPRLAA